MVPSRARPARWFAALAAFVLLPFAAFAQVNVTTPAGAVGSFGTADNADGTLARFNEPASLASDGTFIYIADSNNGRIRKMNISTGAVTTLVTGLLGPSGVAVDGSGNVYVAETSNHVIKVFNAGGTLTSTIGTLGTSGLNNGTLTTSTFSTPVGVAVNSAGTLIYVTDTFNDVVRRVDIGGNAVTTIASGFSRPWGIAISSDGGTLYVTDHNNGLVKSIAVPANTVTTLSGTYSIPRGVAVQGTDVYVSDSGTNTIKKISGPTVTTLAGTGATGSANGLGTSAQFNTPFGLVATAANSLFVADSKNHTIRRILPASAPSITSANNTTFALNAFGSFSVTATGSPAPTFSIVIGTLPSGVTLSSGGLLAGTPTQSGSFPVTIRATNVVSFNDQSFTLTVTGTAAPQIVTSPSSFATDIGMNANFSGSASGAPVPTLRWQRQAAAGGGFNDLNEAFPYSGTTTGTLTITSVTGGMNGDQFRLVASNSSGPDAVSSVATLSINNAAPVFTLSPVNTNILPGGNGTFTAAAIGSPTPTLRWQRQLANTSGFFDLSDDLTFGGTATGTLTITAASVLLNGDQFRLVATNVNGSTPSIAATLTVTATQPVISLQPVSVIANIGGNTSFSSGATGNPTPTYRWQRQPSGTVGFIDLFDDGTYGGTTSTTLTLTNISAGMGGDQFRMVATNIGGAVPSTSATLTVNLGTTISTFAGLANFQGSIDGTGSAARFNGPSSIVVDTSGNFYIADTASHVIRKMTANGVVTTIAGLAGASGSVDGFGSLARFNAPSGVAVDSAGNVYVADTFNHVIRVISPSGSVTTLAGSANASGALDGVGPAARFFLPSGVAVDNVGTVYVADSGNHCIRRITVGGTVSTFAGALGGAGFVNGVGINSRFNTPNSLIIDNVGNVYVADSINNAIRKITSGAVVTTVAGNPGGASGSADGNGTAASFTRPSGLALDSAGNLYVADTVNSTIRKITPAGDVTTLAGTAGNPGYLDGVGPAVRFNRPFGIVVDSNGNLYVADTVNQVIRRSGSTVAPSIITQPGNRTVALGQSATFTVGAAGTPPPTSFQWQRQPAGGFEFTNISADATYGGVSTATLTVSNVTQIMTGDQFRVVVSNGVSPSAVSQAATLSVGLPPVFTSVAAASFRAGQANSFTVSTDSATPVVFSATGLPAWATFNSSTGLLSGNPPDTTGSPLALTITANNGVSATQSFTLTILPANLPPVIATQPAGSVIDPGQGVTFSVSVTGTAPFSYQWRRNGIALAGATSSTLILTGVQAASSGVYSVAVTNAFGTATSSGAALVVNSAPEFTLQPQPQIAQAGGSASFSAAAVGSGTLAYQWRRNGVPIAGANGASFTIGAVSATDAGNYDVQVSNNIATVQSSTATLALVTAPTAPQTTLSPIGRTAVVGGSATFTAAATGAPAPGYQWRKNGVAIPGANGATLSFSSVQAGDAALYDVVFTNSAGTATTASAALTVITRSYSGTYFGTYSGGLGSWALYVRDDNTGVFLSYLPFSSAPIMSLNVIVGDNGQFTFSQSAIAEGGEAGGPARAAALQPVTLTATIGANGIVSGDVTGGAVGTLSGTVAPVNGGTLGVAGFYQAGSSANSAVTYTIAGPNGLSYVLAQAGAVFDGGAGTVSSTGSVNVSTGRSIIAQTISADAGLITGSSSGLIVASALSGGSDLALARQRLLNISTRARVGTAENVLIAGFVISGQQSKPVLIRAVGPTLGVFGVPGVLATPRLELFRGNTSLAVNAGIAGNRAAIDAAGVQAGAFALGAAGTDAAILTTLPPGAYSAQVSSTGTTTGIALVEVYDLSGPTPGQKLLNISTRAAAGTAENQLTAGFVVPGGTSKRVLIRGVGPGLTVFGVPGVLAQPTLTLTRGGTQVATNTNWSTSADASVITTSSAQVGAFALANNDSAMVLTLTPGNYSATVTGAAAAPNGVALIEVYELP